MVCEFEVDGNLFVFCEFVVDGNLIVVVNCGRWEKFR